MASAELKSRFSPRAFVLLGIRQGDRDRGHDRGMDRGNMVPGGLCQERGEREEKEKQRRGMIEMV